MKQFVDFKTYNKNNPFGIVDKYYYPTTHHHIGSDFKVPVGTPIKAPCDGEILKVVFNHARGNTAIFVLTVDGVEWGLELCHLRELPKEGDYKEGDVIAHSGNTGSASSGAHLHVVMHRDVRVTKNYSELTSEAAYWSLVKAGKIVDPYAFFVQHGA